MKSRSFSLKSQLSLGFASSFLVFIIISFAMLISISFLAEYIKKLYNHPFTVYPATLQIRINLKKIELNIYKLDFYDNKLKTLEYLDIIKATEEKIEQNFKIIQNRFLGDKNLVTKGLHLFGEIKKIKTRIAINLLSGKRNENDKIMKTELDKKFSEITLLTDQISNFARNKAKEFIEKSDLSKTALMIILVISIIIVLLLKILMAYLTIKKVIPPVKYITDITLRIANKDLDINIDNKFLNKNNEIGMMLSSIEMMRKQLILKFSEEEERYKSLFNSMISGLAYCEAVKINGQTDFDLKFVDINPAFENLTGEKRINLIGKTVKELFPEMEPFWFEQFKKVLDSGKPLYFEEYSKNLKKHLEVFLYKIKYGLVGIFNDISNRKKLATEKEVLIKELEEKHNILESTYEELSQSNEELEVAYNEAETSQRELESANIDLEKALIKANEANKLKEELLAIMSHEIRTPLSGIIGFSELFSDEINTITEKSTFCKKHQENIDFIHKSAIRLNELLTNLLELSTLQAGKEIKLEYKEFDIEQVILNIFTLFRNRLSELNNTYGIEFKCEKIIYSEPMRIQQILFNLIGNAIKFTNNGNINVIISIEDNSYLIEIRDTGIGIKAEDQEAIFDIFHQLDSSSTRTFQGVGLGLTVCKKFVEAMKGKIWVQSEFGKGSSFFIKIPLVDRKDEAKKENSKSNYHVDVRMRILFAENDEMNFNLIQKLLLSIGIKEFKGFKQGKSLLDFFVHNQDFDMIILDIQMPEMDGVQCLKEIRKFDKNIPVIALTAYSLKSDREKYLEIGFNEYIAKPIIKTDFLNVLSKYQKG